MNAKFNTACHNIVNNHLQLAIDRNLQVDMTNLRTLYIKRDNEIIASDENQVAYRFKFRIVNEERETSREHVWTSTEICYVSFEVVLSVISIGVLIGALSTSNTQAQTGQIVAALFTGGIVAFLECKRRKVASESVKINYMTVQVEKCAWERIVVNGICVTVNSLDLVTDEDGRYVFMNIMEFWCNGRGDTINKVLKVDNPMTVPLL
jgi:hypothetical protein